MCDADLPSGWHADHIQRFAETRRTNVHEMQPLCPSCHHKKTSMENAHGFFEDRPINAARPPRKHQTLFADELKRINAGLTPRNVTVMDILPGGGKSALPQMGTWRIDKGHVDAIIWVVPWKALKKQACDGFNGNSFNPIYAAIDRDNEAPLIPKSDFSPKSIKIKPTRVVVASYAGVASNPGIYVDFMEKYRCDLYLDEVHHLCDGEPGEGEDAKGWSVAINSLAPLSKHLFAMGGTLDNGQQIPFVQYQSDGEDRMYPISDISYGFKNALEERAIIRIEPIRVNGYAEFSHKGQKHEVILEKARTIKESKQALRTCVVTGDFAQKMLATAAEHFINHQKFLKQYDYSSKMLVVAPSTGEADAYKAFLEQKYGHEMRVAVAHTNVGKGGKPHETIEDFKKADGFPHKNDRKLYECLVTVGMAYEGLDVPDISHLVALTFTRTKGWITQMIARSWRVDYRGVSKGYKWEVQSAFLFVPDDKLMNAIIEKLMSEQKDALRDQGPDTPGPDGPTPPPPPSTFVPHTSDLENLSYATKTGEKMLEFDSYWISELLRECPYYISFPPHVLIEKRDSGEIQFTPLDRTQDETERTPLDHAALRKQCQELAARIDGIYMERHPGSYQYGYANKQAVKYFRMKREEMGIEDLTACLDWLNQWLASIEELETV